MGPAAAAVAFTLNTVALALPQSVSAPASTAGTGPALFPSLAPKQRAEALGSAETICVAPPEGESLQNSAAVGAARVPPLLLVLMPAQSAEKTVVPALGALLGAICRQYLYRFDPVQGEGRLVQCAVWLGRWHGLLQCDVRSGDHALVWARLAAGLLGGASAWLAPSVAASVKGVDRAVLPDVPLLHRSGCAAVEQLHGRSERVPVRSTKHHCHPNQFAPKAGHFRTLVALSW